MHILHVAGSLGPGGIERLVFDLSLVQREAGHKVSVALLSPLTHGDPGTENRERQLRQQGVEVLHVAGGTRDVIGAVKWFRTRGGRAGSVDVVHAHLLAGVVASGIGLGRPTLVWTLHSTKFQFPVRLIRLTDPLVDAYVGCAKSVSREFSSRVREEIRTIENGVDLASFDIPHPHGGADAEPELRLISVGALRPEKNHVRMIRALVLAKPRLGAQGVRLSLRITGGGDRLGFLAREVEAAGASGFIELLGTRTDIPTLLSQSDAFVLSSDNEGLPIALLEAMASGLPSVVTPFEGAADVVWQRESGLIAGSFDAEALAECIVEIGSDAVLRDKLGSQALKMAAQYDIRRCAEDYESLYRELISS